MPLSPPIPSSDGRKIFVVGRTIRGELVHCDSKSGKLLSFLQGISAEYVNFSRDGQWVVYVSFPDGSLWRSKVDGTERLQLSYPPSFAFMPRWSPDGRSIAFFALDPNGKAAIFTVPQDGGTPQRLLPDEAANQTDPNWSPDGSKVIFSRVGQSLLHDSHPRPCYPSAHNVAGLAEFLLAALVARWTLCTCHQQKLDKAHVVRLPDPEVD